MGEAFSKVPSADTLHPTAVRVMDAIFAIHLRGVADPFPPVPLLTKTAVDAVKPARFFASCRISAGF